MVKGIIYVILQTLIDFGMLLIALASLIIDIKNNNRRKNKRNRSSSKPASFK